MGQCNYCDGTGKEKYIGAMTIIYSTCKECGGTGNDKKPKCPKHKISHKYCGIIGWYCPKCEFAAKISWWEDVYCGE